MKRCQRRWLLCIILAILVVAEAQESRAAARDFVQPGNFAAQPGPSKAPQAPGAITTVTPEEILAGHLLRRIGFGPDPKLLKKVVKKGLTGFIDQQLNPSSIGDNKALGKLPKYPLNEFYDDYTLMRRWYIRMVWTQRVLQEKMTLIWHEHFATSNEKVGIAGFMLDYEDQLRQYSLGNFRDFLINMTKNQAMLIWLDNNYNSARDNNGDFVPPNENYGRELMQLFTLGTKTLNIDGSPVLDNNNNPIPPYTESDVREVARALTGFYTPYPYKHNNAQFSDWQHDERDKVIFGAPFTGKSGDAGATEVDDVIDRILTMRKDTVAAFISKMLIQKLATETPTPQYVAAVATAFRDSNWSIKAAVEAILKNPEFTSDAVVRSQYKEPIEQFIHMVRAFKGKTDGGALVNWTYDASQLVYYPPSVFSFYPPGNKGALLSTASVFIRDRIADEYTRGWSDTFFVPDKLIQKNKLTTPTAVADYLEKTLLAAPMSTTTRTELLSYMGSTVDETTFRGAVWLVLCSPDFQRN